SQAKRQVSDRLFLDANVLFTVADNAAGKAAFLFDWQAPERWQLCTSAHALEEARRNLQRKYPQFGARLETLSAAVAMVPQPHIPALPIELPEKDRPILAAALGAKCSHLLTGDRKHFGAFMNKPEHTSGLLIQTVAQYLATISKNGGDLTPAPSELDPIVKTTERRI
ncbi:MAG: PIN domain-containing protein, partial [Sinobacteraceae bacterium]|nr:PIN domain-containing protein [Nevskiaceae bacterium]